MAIEKKLSEFLSGGVRGSIPIAMSDLATIGIQNGNNLRNCWFEQSVQAESSLLTRTRSCFIGSHSYLNAGGYMRGHVFIGRFCSIGRRVSLAAGSHPYHGLGTHPLLVYGEGRDYDSAESTELGIRPPRDRHTVVGNDVWIGDGAVIVPGVTIGTGAVVGANAVVTKDVPHFAIVAGTPAKVLRYRFPEHIRARILSSRWWNLPIPTLRSFPVRNVFDFLEQVEKRGEASTDETPTYHLDS